MRMAELPRKITDDPYGAAILIRRLITEQGATYWRRYLLAFGLMAVSAATTAGSAYLLGEVINQAYVDKNVRGIAILSGVTILIFMLKGAATYGHSVILSQISNAILANNQRRLFAKLMCESVGFFSERHSSEFLARLTSGAYSVTQVLNLLINALGRDLLLLIGLVAVMVMQDPYMALLGFAAAPPTFSKPCRNRCRASAPSRHSHSNTRCASGSMPASARSSATPTRWRGFPTVRAR